MTVFKNPDFRIFPGNSDFSKCLVLAQNVGDHHHLAVYRGTMTVFKNPDFRIFPENTDFSKCLVLVQDVGDHHYQFLGESLLKFNLIGAT